MNGEGKPERLKYGAGYSHRIDNANRLVYPKNGENKGIAPHKLYLRGLTKAQYFQLRELCFFSNCLYNFALYNIRQVDEQDLQLNLDNSLAIDMGIDNFATCVTNFGTSFIMDGRKIKNINRKQTPRLFAVNPLETRPLLFETSGENNAEKEQSRKGLFEENCPLHCIANDIGTIICGYNPDFKRGMNLNKKINQQFTQISFGALRRQLQKHSSRNELRGTGRKLHI